MGKVRGWLGWVVLVLYAAGSAACGADDRSADLRALTARIESMEAAQEQDRELMARTLEASTGQLALVLSALRRDKGQEGSTPAEGTPGEVGTTEPGEGVAEPPTSAESPTGVDPAGDPTIPAGDEPTGNETAGAQQIFEFDFEQAAVIFLAVSVGLLILVLVFFPKRLRGPVATAQFSASEEVPAAPPAPRAVDTQRTPDVVMPPDGADEEDDRPIRHRLALPAGQPESLRSLVDTLDTYLSTEPYILRHPEPRVALLKGELHLQFFALPSLSETEHALLDATVRRLLPDRGASEGSPAA